MAFSLFLTFRQPGDVALPEAGHAEFAAIVGATPENAALNSPTRREMRADFRRLPPFRGSNTHFAMHTRTIPGALT